MFAVIYQGFLKPGMEETYQTAWNHVVHYFKAHRGALGSCLHQAEDGSWVAYSRWPDRQTRDRSWPGENDPANDLSNDIKEAILTLKDCIDPAIALKEICMDIKNDLLI